MLVFKQENPLRFVSCCGLIAKTCKVFIQKFCRGYKYNTKEWVQYIVPTILLSLVGA